ncbi:DUF4129 domain-containing protein [Micromonospora endophytica]|uniref:Uncharacterized protein n=1 Tax=Micromonospora endophytica TaxID=515350 RepID=A0A2W2C5N5_9ACTN|nr:DUF4129 domain-containing protein [Micromonospora endophytica]PZF93100.1 hypothetical protein C1I93_18405 [Micromonospora endophytica]RIW45406.1 DUF4129 domain-containing protein [Micromonospora endophytica]BCJ58533.1 hypothetical protein Jiend_19550 [Micromonospora endophytica]
MATEFLRRFWPLATVIGLLAVVTLAAANSSIGASRVPPVAKDAPFVLQYPTENPPSSIAAEPREAAESTRTQLPSWLGPAMLVLLGAVLLAIFGYLLWSLARGVAHRVTRRLPTSPARRSAEGTAREVVAAVDAGLTELDDRSTDPRTAVIACWVRLEEAAGAAGVPRLTGDTPTDLVTRLLRGDESAGVPAIVSADVLGEFAHVYREARYATRPVDERTRDQARAALRRLRGELTEAEVTA